jgi:hypothetical protein
MMIGYDIYDRVTMEHFRLRQSMILTTSFFCSRQYLYCGKKFPVFALMQQSAHTGNFTSRIR